MLSPETNLQLYRRAQEQGSGVMPSQTLDRHRRIANGGKATEASYRRLAAETVSEIMSYREALFRCAPSHQGGHSTDGGAIADALGVAFPLNVPELEAAAKDEGMHTAVLWPWLYKMRAAEGW